MFSLLAAAAVAAAVSGPPLTLKPCAVQTVRARCGSFHVPEDRTKPAGRQIALRVVVVPAREKPVAGDAITYIAGGPGGASTDMTQTLTSDWAEALRHRDLLLVDQRGTGVSNAYSCPPLKAASPTTAQVRAYIHSCLAGFGGDPTQYGTRAAMDDLDAVRAALGYRRLDVIGGSYGATAAQVFLARHPTATRSVVLMGATALDVPFYGRFARNAQRSLGRIAALCSSDADCRAVFPGWTRTFSELVRKWDAHPQKVGGGTTLSGAGLASIVQNALLGLDRAVALPLVITQAAKGNYAPLRRQAALAAAEAATPSLMFWSIWCSEPWVGLGARGPWGTDFDTMTAGAVKHFRQACSLTPMHAESSAWRFPASKTVPVLAIQGGADPQDPPSNLPALKQHFPDSKMVVLPWYGHHFGTGGCVGQLVAGVVARGTTRGLDTSCVASVVPPLFPLR